MKTECVVYRTHLPAPAAEAFGENIATGRWTAEKKARIRDSRVHGTRLLCETLAQLPTPPRVLVSASAIGYIGFSGSTGVSMLAIILILPILPPMRDQRQPYRAVSRNQKRHYLRQPRWRVANVSTMVKLLMNRTNVLHEVSSRSNPSILALGLQLNSSQTRRDIMVFDVLWFAFGLFITLLVGLGVVLAVTEFRMAHAPRSLIERR
jgi:hypothetical protein